MIPGPRLVLVLERPDLLSLGTLHEPVEEVSDLEVLAAHGIKSSPVQMVPEARARNASYIKALY